MVTYSKRYIPGDRLVECDICGFDYRFTQMRKGKAKGQKGFKVCPDCFDDPHPLDTKPELRSKSKLPEVE